MTGEGLLGERTVSLGLLDQVASFLLRLRFSTNASLQVKQVDQFAEGTRAMVLCVVYLNWANLHSLSFGTATLFFRKTLKIWYIETPVRTQRSL